MHRAGGRDAVTGPASRFCHKPMSFLITPVLINPSLLDTQLLACIRYSVNSHRMRVCRTKTSAGHRFSRNHVHAWGKALDLLQVRLPCFTEKVDAWLPGPGPQARGPSCGSCGLENPSLALQLHLPESGSVGPRGCAHDSPPTPPCQAHLEELDPWVSSAELTKAHCRVCAGSMPETSLHGTDLGTVHMPGPGWLIFFFLAALGLHCCLGFAPVAVSKQRQCGRVSHCADFSCFRAQL